MGFVGVFSTPSSPPQIIAPYSILKSESHKKEKSGAEAEAASIPEEDPGSMVWGRSERCCSVTLLLSVTLWSAVSRVHSVFHHHTQQLSIKSHIAYLLNSQFALKHSQAEPEYIWKA